MRGEREGYWVVDELVLGGSAETRGTLGADFRIIHSDTNIGRNLWIEYKNDPVMSFTEMQKYRMESTFDSPSEAMRVIGLNSAEGDHDKVKILFIWTPNLFRAFPRESFTRVVPRSGRGVYYRFSLKGLESCIKKHTFSMYQDVYKGEIAEKLLESPNITIYTPLKGEFGTPGVAYSYIPKERAFNIIYEKLIRLISNLEEDTNRIYPKCQRQETLTELTTRIIEETIMEMLPRFYRMVYVADVVEKVRKHPSLTPHIHYEGRKPMIEKTSLSSKVNRVFRQLVHVPVRNPRGIVGSVRTGGKISYGWKGRTYVPLSYSACEFLDSLKRIYELFLSRTPEVGRLSPSRTCVSIKDIARIEGGSDSLHLGRFNRSRTELEDKGIITIPEEDRFIIRTKICLTIFAIDFITRTNEFADNL